MCNLPETDKKILEEVDSGEGNFTKRLCWQRMQTGHLQLISLLHSLAKERRDWNCLEIGMTSMRNK